MQRPDEVPRPSCRRVALKARDTTEQWRELARYDAPAATVSAPLRTVPLNAAQHEDLVKRLYVDTRMLDKPRSVTGIAKDISLGQSKDMLQAATLVSNDAACEPAIRGGLAVRDEIVTYGLSSARQFAAALPAHPPREDDAAWTRRVQLSLTGSWSTLRRQAAVDCVSASLPMSIASACAATNQRLPVRGIAPAIPRSSAATCRHKVPSFLTIRFTEAAAVSTPDSKGATTKASSELPTESTR